MLLDIKYCKNCVNFTPNFSKSALKPEDDYSWGYCRMITKLKVTNNLVHLVQREEGEVVVEKVVAANQVVQINKRKICPVFGGLSDMFKEGHFIETTSIEAISKLSFVKCKNCYHVFASVNKKIFPENDYTCPICFHKDKYLEQEHFHHTPKFMSKELN